MKSPRKDQLKALLAGPGEASPSPALPAAQPRIRTFDEPRVVSGSVRALGRSLGELGAAAEEAAALRAQIADGDHVVELAPEMIDPSFVTDRLHRAEAQESTWQAFVADIGRHGQQTPVLVRPHPERSGRYQIAYGHRRLAAARDLGRPVRAVVRSLSDAELVVAQGQENAQRRDLSFIEKAFFARALDERGFDRATLVAALAVQTAEITRLLQVSRAVPAEIAARIGPAPKAGRPRWMALAERLRDPAARLRVEKALEAAGDGDSDARFARAVAATAAPAARPAPEVVLRDGPRKALADFLPERGGARLRFAGPEAAAFAADLAARLPTLFEDWRRQRPKPKSPAEE